MSNQDRSNTTKKSTVYVALITALAIIIGSVILGLGGQTSTQDATAESTPAAALAVKLYPLASPHVNKEERMAE